MSTLTSKYLCILIFCVAVLYSTDAQQCSQYTSCKTCLAHETVCSWCEAANTCLDKGSAAQCADLFTFKQQCDDACTDRTESECEDCECIWCYDSAQCWAGNLTAAYGPITCARHHYTCPYGAEAVKVLVIAAVALALTALIGLGLWMVYRQRKGLRPWPFGKRHEYTGL